jgi:hypothetical protein
MDIILRKEHLAMIKSELSLATESYSGQTGIIIPNHHHPKLLSTQMSQHSCLN